MIPVIALLAAAAIITPHVLRLECAHPASAAIIWCSALCLRALVALFVALFAVVYVPATALFHHVTHWCWHTAVPLVTSDFGLSGHSVGDVALLAPLLAIAVSLVSVCVALWRATRALSDWVRRTSIGPGPHESLIVVENDIVVAAAGLRHPRIIVSAGALTSFDDDELAAGLAHERAHITHRHRFVLVVAEICRALARPLPGTRRALAELIFHLERDADRWAVQRKHDPTALASAICQAAHSPADFGRAVITLGGGAITRRVLQLLHYSPARRRRRLDLLATAMVLLAIGLAAALPPATRAAIATAGQGSTVHPCH